MNRDRLFRIEGPIETTVTNPPIIFENDLPFSLNHYDKVCIIGKNAAGKTLLIRKFADLIAESNDEIKIIGIDDEDELAFFTRRLRRRSGMEMLKLIKKGIKDLEKEIQSDLSNGIKTVLFLEINHIPNQSQILKLITNLECTVILTGMRYSSQSVPLDACNKIIILDFNLLMLHERRRKLTFVDWSTGKNVSDFKHFVKFMETGRKLNSLWVMANRNKQKIGNMRLSVRKEIRDLESTMEIDNNINELMQRKTEIIHFIKKIDREMEDAWINPHAEEERFYLQEKLAKLENDLDSYTRKIKHLERQRQDSHSIYIAKEIINEMQVIEKKYHKFFEELQAIKAEFDLISREENLWIQQIKMFEESPNLELEYIEYLGGNLKDVVRDSTEIEVKVREFKEINSIKEPEKRFSWYFNESEYRFKSSASILLCDNKKKETSDDLRKIALFYSEQFLIESRGHYGKEIQKLIVVNNLEKFLKYSINTFPNRENTNIIIHSNGNKKDVEKGIHIPKKVLNRKHADVIIIDCDNEISKSEIKRYLNQYRVRGTKEGHLLFIDINNSFTDKGINSHAFNQWTKNLERRTKTGEQSMSAGLHDIIKIKFDPEQRIEQKSRKANQFVPKLEKFNQLINQDWLNVCEIDEKYDSLNIELVQYWTTVYEKYYSHNKLDLKISFLELDKMIAEGSYNSAIQELHMFEMKFNQQDTFNLFYELKILMQYMSQGVITGGKLSLLDNRIESPKDSMKRLSRGLFLKNISPSNALEKYLKDNVNTEDYENISAKVFGLPSGKILPKDFLTRSVKVEGNQESGFFDYLQGNIFDINFSPLLKIKIPKYNFKIIDSRLVADYKSKMMHLRDKVSQGSSSGADLVCMGWSILVNNNEINRMFILLNFCEIKEQNMLRLFRLLLDLVITENIPAYKIEDFSEIGHKTLIDELKVTIPYGTYDLKELIIMKGIFADSNDLKIIISQKIGNYDFKDLEIKDILRSSWVDSVVSGNTDESFENWCKNINF